MKDQPMWWISPNLFEIMTKATEEDKVRADLEMVSLKQYMFNRWMSMCQKCIGGFNRPCNRVKLSRFKCWFWRVLPKSILGVDDRSKFKHWSIGHCLNCTADPYDGVVEAWSYYGNLFRGALIRCNKCNQLRWQFGESNIDY